MKIKIKHNHWLPKLIRVGGITIYPYILLRDKPESVPKTTIYKHEMHHCYQIEEIGFCWFYLSYLFYFLGALFQYRNWGKAYHEIPYEEEAYFVQDDPLTKLEIEHLNNEGIEV